MYCRVRAGQGVILVVVLWILVTLTVLVLGLSMGTRRSNTAHQVDADRICARWLARAGIAYAISVLKDDDRSLDGRNDLWYDNPSIFRQAKLSTGTFTVYSESPSFDESLRYGPGDEASRLNLLWATPEQVARLPEMTSPDAQLLLNWLETTPPGNERRMNQLGELSTLRQLGTLANYSAEFLYGEDLNLNGLLDASENDGDQLLPNDDQDGKLDYGLLHWLTIYSYDLEIDGKGKSRLNINEIDYGQLTGELGFLPENAHWIIHHRPFEAITDLISENPTALDAEVISLSENSGTGNLDQEIVIFPPSIEVFRQVADRITVSSESKVYGRININTAPREVLIAALDLDKALVDNLINYREALPLGFSETGEIFDVPGITVPDIKKIIPRVTVRSYVFRIRSYGQARNSHQNHQIETVVDRGRGEEIPKVLYWKETD